jgi:coproporphyrinogen III oxidase
MRAKFEMMIRAAQNEICAAIEEVDGQKFKEDNWTRPGGRDCQILGGNAGSHTSSDGIQLRRRGFKVRVDDVAGYIYERTLQIMFRTNPGT